MRIKVHSACTKCCGHTGLCELREPHGKVYADCVFLHLKSLDAAAPASLRMLM